MCCERWRIRLLPGAHHTTARIRTAGNFPDSRSRAGAKCCNPALRYRRAFSHQQCALGRPDICECMDVDSRVATEAHGTSMRRCADRRSCGSSAGASNGHPSSQDRAAGKTNRYEGGCGARLRLIARSSFRSRALTVAARFPPPRVRATVVTGISSP